MTTSPSETAASTLPLFPFDNSYARLPAPFQLRQQPSAATAPVMIRFNRQLAAELGLQADRPDGPAGAAILAPPGIPPRAQPSPLAPARHQVGQFLPPPRHGPAILPCEVIDRNGVRRDIQLKGGGPTPFSRRGDGRAALGPVLREYIVSEAMHALGIPSTRALAAVLTGDQVYRETVLPGAVFTRVAASHIRVGTFQFFAARGDVEGLQRLADYVIRRHYPAVAEAENPALALLQAIIERQAALIARWMSVGFIHGVMNTDNMTVSGETIDFGPCAFLDAYDPAKVFSSIDHSGRYAYRNQPAVAQWNLARLAETFLPLLDADIDKAVEIANDQVIRFAHLYQAQWLLRMRSKIGLATAEDGDAALIEALLDAMHRGGADFTLTFRGLCNAVTGNDERARAQFGDAALYDGWAEQWRARLAREPEDTQQRQTAMRAVNPFLIPRNHRIEQAIAAGTAGNFAVFERLADALVHPFDEHAEDADLAMPPRDDERVLRTFCGT